MVGIEAVLFDVYGTLLISASGDIGEAVLSEGAALTALAEAGMAVRAPDRKAAGRKAIAAFQEQIEAVHAAARRSGVPSPEVDIVDIWRQTAVRLETEGVVRVNPEADFSRCALVFELLCNPVYPMPGLAPVVRDLAAGGRPLGIVSNAQFFTPLILNYFLNGTIGCHDTAPVAPFDAQLTFYSYRYRRAKPDPFLYYRAAEELRRRGIEPAQALYIGNDMLNDVWAAHQAGFKTVLFAGDKRSLRLREHRSETAGLEPDAIVTELAQIVEIVL